MIFAMAFAFVLLAGGIALSIGFALYVLAMLVTRPRPRLLTADVVHALVHTNGSQNGTHR